MTRIERKNLPSIFSGFVGGALSLTLSNLIVKILGLIYKIPLSYLLTDEGMGYFNSAYTVFGLFYLLCTAGVPKGVMIICSEENAKGENNTRQVLRGALRAFLIIGISLTALMIVFSVPIVNLIGNHGALFTVLSIAPAMIFIALEGVLRGYLSSVSKFLDIAVAGVIEGVAKLTLGLVFALIGVRMNLSLEIISALTILGVVFGSIFGFIYMYKSSDVDKKAGQNTVLIKKSVVLKKIIKISLPITLSSAVMSLSGIIDLGLVMRRLLDIGFSKGLAVTLYGNYTTLAVPMFNFALSLITPISIIFLPKLVAAKSQGNLQEYNALFSSSVRLVSFLSAPLTFGLAAYSNEILSLVFGSTSAALGSDFLKALAPAVAPASFLIIINTALEAEGHYKIPIYSMLIGAFAKTIFGYFAIGNPNISILGAPFGSVIMYATALLVSGTYSALKSEKITYLLIHSVGYYVAAFISVLLSRFAFLKFSSSFKSTFLLLGAIACCALIYLVFCHILAKKSYQKTRYQQNTQI